MTKMIIMICRRSQQWFLISVLLVYLLPVHRNGVFAMTCVSQCECDATLLEVRCVGRTLTSVPQRLPIDTKHLILQWNFIRFSERSSNNTFLLPDLLTLDLSRNRISMIPMGLLAPLISTEELRFGYNQITAIDWNVFKDMKKLKRLYLNRNLITDIVSPAYPGVVQGGVPPTMSLDILHLGNNRLQVLSQGVFSGVASIDTLYLQNNLIHTIEAGVFNDTRVRYLNMGANRLSPTGFNVDHMSDLEELVVYSNTLTLDGSTSLVGLSSLRVLSMASNSVRSIANGTFADLTNLKELYLEGNDINVDNLIRELSAIGDMTALGLSSDALTEFPYWLCDLYPMLTAIHITNSNIYSINANLSQKCKHLTTINLKLNQITSIAPQSFANLTFNYLHLQSNQIESLPYNSFSIDANPSISPIEVFLDSNPLFCDCRMQYLFSLPAAYQLSGKCSSPQALSGRAISALTSDTFNCETTTIELTTTPEITSTLVDSTLNVTTSFTTSTKQAIFSKEATPELSTQNTGTRAETTSLEPVTTSTPLVTTSHEPVTTSLVAVNTEPTRDVLRRNLTTQSIPPPGTTTRSDLYTDLSTTTRSDLYTDFPAENTPSTGVIDDITTEHMNDSDWTTQSAPGTEAVTPPGVGTVETKERSLLWVAYLSAVLFVVLLLLTIVAVTACYKKHMKAAERVGPDTEKHVQANHIIGNISGEQEKDTRIENGGFTIYIMDDKRHSIQRATSLTEDNRLESNNLTAENESETTQHTGYYPYLQEIADCTSNGHTVHDNDQPAEIRPMERQASSEQGLTASNPDLIKELEVVNTGNRGGEETRSKRKQSREELKPVESVLSTANQHISMNTQGKEQQHISMNTQGKEQTVSSLPNGQVYGPEQRKQSREELKPVEIVESSTDKHIYSSQPDMVEKSGDRQTCVESDEGQCRSERKLSREGQCGSERKLSREGQCGSERKLSREEMKPVETVDSSPEDFVLVSGVTSEVTRF